MKNSVFIYFMLLSLSAVLIGCTTPTDNNPPVIDSVNVSPAITVKVGETAQLTAIVTDKERDSLIYYWTANSGKVPGGSQGATVPYTAPLQGGFDYVTVKVTDGKDTSELIVSITVISSNDSSTPSPIEGSLPTVAPVSIEPTFTPFSTLTQTITAVLPPTNTVIPTSTLAPTPTLPPTDIPVPTLTPVTGNCSMLTFQSDLDGDLEIYTLNIETGNVIQLTYNDRRDSGPTWSPDGSKIAFESEELDGNYEIYVMNADGSGQVRLTDNPNDDLAPSWHPDGSKIVFQSDRESSDSDNRSINQIFTIDVNTKQVQQVTNTRFQKYAPVWSPDGTKIAYFSRHEGNRLDIFVLDMINLGTSPIQLQGTDSGVDSVPQWSPDGAQIIFVTYDDFYIMDSNGTHMTLFEQHSAVDQYPAWGPNCPNVAFGSNRDSHSPGPDQYDIYMKEPNGIISRLTVWPESNESQPAWHP